MPAFDLSYPGAYIVVVTVTAVIWSLLVLGIRLFLRLKVNGPLSWDDGCCIAATILACIHSVLTLLQLRSGLGRSGGTQPQTTINWSSFLLWLSGYFYYMAQALSMLSVCFLLARIVRHRKMARGCYGIAVATVAWALAGMATTAFECGLPRPWETHDASANCIDLLGYHKGVAGDGEYPHGKWLYLLRASGAMAGSAADDNLYQSVIMLWSLNMHLAPKLQTIAAFSMRLLILPPLLIRLHFNHVSLFSNDWPRARVPAVILGQVVLHLSIILTTVPCAKPFLRIFDSGSLHLDPNFAKKLSLLSIKRKKSDGNNSQSTGEANDAFDRRAASGGGGGTWRRAARWDRMLLRPDHSSTVTMIKHDAESPRRGEASNKEAGRRSSFQSSESSRKVITRTDSFYVSYEAALQYPEPARKKSKDTTVSFELDVLTK
ncbi:hypothetical protein KC343_g9034 [Hortaea werneckii]|nr:hypothetical protein KC352_g14845 [Hortaea werneckii]KAI7561126.1 hypothetical protein KC317_g9270 [Hortaea werneckii]KAI7610138.1 hypothetical protein KC346_g8876 [Hortaea werneckii]KAI7618637.1 hypothetical protein KC343_g9034 [Hortaea werneckii]KAI7660358.1 hypothetical protein KC319_g8689 [Hortaea werneckii]